MAKKQIAENWGLYLAIAIILAVVGTVFVINKTTPAAYNLGACTYNMYTCDYPAWDGECTQTIEDECCDYVDIRWCDGQAVDDYWDCYDKYCAEEGKKCEGIINIATGGYTCKCMDLYNPV